MNSFALRPGTVTHTELCLNLFQVQPTEEWVMSQVPPVVRRSFAGIWQASTQAFVAAAADGSLEVKPSPADDESHPANDPGMLIVQC